MITDEKASLNKKWLCYQDSILRKDNVLYLSATAVPKRRHVSSCDIDDYVSDVAVLRERSMNNFSRFSNDHSYISSLGGWMMISSAIVVVILIVSKLT